MGETILVWAQVLREAFTLGTAIVDGYQRWQEGIAALERQAQTEQERTRSARRARIMRNFEQQHTNGDAHFNSVDRPQYIEALADYRQALNSLNQELNEIQLDINTYRQNINIRNNHIRELQQTNQDIQNPPILRDPNFNRDFGVAMGGIGALTALTALVGGPIMIPVMLVAMGAGTGASLAIDNVEVNNNNRRITEERIPSEQNTQRLEETINTQQIYNRMLASIHYNIGMTLYRLGRYERALVHLDLSIDLRPNYRLSHNLRGTIYFRLKEKSNTNNSRLYHSTSAIQDFSVSIRSLPDQDRIHAFLAFLSGEWHNVIHRGMDALGAETIERTNNSELLILIGKAQLQQNNHQEALRIFNRVLALLRETIPTESVLREDIFVLRARCHEALGNQIAARNDFRRALCLNARNRDALIPLANWGDNIARRYLGYSYFEDYLGTGQNMPAQDAQQALRWIQEAANNGDVGAVNLLGILYQYGFGVEHNMARAREYYQESYNQGYRNAANNLASFHENGLGDLPVNQAIAQNLYIEAANNNAAIAHYNLGLRYENGTGIDRNVNTAFDYFRHSAERGFKNAQYKLGLIYETGQGLPPGTIINAGRPAISWYKKAAKQGYGIAMFRCGHCYENGIGVTQNQQLAIAFYRAAQARGSNEAAAAIARLRQAGHGNLIDNTPIDPVYLSPFPKRPPLIPPGQNGGFVFEQEVIPTQQRPAQNNAAPQRQQNPAPTNNAQASERRRPRDDTNDTEEQQRETSIPRRTQADDVSSVRQSNNRYTMFNTTDSGQPTTTDSGNVTENQEGLNRRCSPSPRNTDNV